MQPRTHILLTLAVVIGLAGNAGAELVSTDLNAGGTETGFTGGWTGSSNVFITASTDLTYANYGITQTGTPGNVYASNAGPDRQDKRSVATPMSGTIWFSALVNVPANANYGGLTINNFNAGQPWNPIDTDLRVLLTPSTLEVGFNSESGTSTGTGSFSPGTHLILGQMNIVAGNDTLSVWVDPDVNAAGGPGGLPAANFTSTTIDFTDSLENLGVAGRKGSATSNVEVDAIRLSDTATAFADVTGAGGPGDTTDPILAAVDPVIPADDAPEASVVSDLVVTFDEKVFFGTGFIRIKESDGGAVVEEFDVENPPANLTRSGPSVTIDPSSNLAASTGYYVEIEATAIDDFSGNSFAGISDTTTWNFTTTSDDTPPAVGTLDIPTNGATEVAIDSSLSLTFGEDVKSGTGNIVIKRTSDDGVVDTIDVTIGTVTIVDGQVTIVPTGDLPALTELYVEIDAGAILDLVDNPFDGISGAGTWSFTTASVPPSLVATDINDGGTDTGFDGDFYNGSNNVFITEAPDLTYAQYGITQTGTIQKVYASNAGPDRQDLRNLTTPMSGEIWFSVLVNVPTGSNYAGLTFNSYGNTYDPITTDARILMGPSQLQVGFNGEAASTGAGTFAADTTHLLLGQMNVGSGNDTLSVWVDPDLSSGGSLPTADFTETTVDFTDSLTIIGVAGRKGAGSDVSIDAIRLSNTATAFKDVTGTTPGSDTFELIIMPNGTGYKLTWASLDGKLYDLVSSTDLSIPRATWPVWDGRVDIEGTAPMNTIPDVPAGPDRTRFFAVIEKDPPPIFSEGFEISNGGFTMVDNTADESGTDWAWGDPDSSGEGGSVTTGNGDSTKCWGTGIGTPGFYANPTDTCLRSPVIDLTGVAAAELSFAQALDLDTGDSVTVNIIDDTTDTPISTNIVTITDTDINTADWESVGPVAIPVAALGQSVRIEWCLNGTGGTSFDFMGWYIDDVVVTETTP